MKSTHDSNKDGPNTLTTTSHEATSNKSVQPSKDDDDSSDNKTRLQLYAIVFTILSAILSSFWTVIMSYLESKDFVWLQVYILGESSNLFYSVLLWLSVMRHKYNKEYNLTDCSVICGNSKTKISNNEMKETLLAKENQNNRNEEYSDTNSKPNSGSSSKSIVPFSKYIFQIFPARSNTHVWKLLLMRGICNAFSFQLYVIGLLFCDSGDAMLIRTSLSSFGVFIVSVLAFGEKLGIWVFIAFFFAFSGLLFVCHPPFTFTGEFDFDNDDIQTVNFWSSEADGVSIWGVLMVSGSATFRIGSKYIIKRSGKLKVHWLVMNIATFIITCSFAIIECIGVLIYYGAASEDSKWLERNFWSDAFGNYKNSLDRFGIMMCVILYGVVFVGKVSFTVVGHQIGDIGRLGVISNSDIVFTYVIGAIILNETGTSTAYFGASLVMIGVVILCLEQAK